MYTYLLNNDDDVPVSRRAKAPQSVCLVPAPAGVTSIYKTSQPALYNVINHVIFTTARNRKCFQMVTPHMSGIILLQKMKMKHIWLEIGLI